MLGAYDNCTWLKRISRIRSAFAEFEFFGFRITKEKNMEKKQFEEPEMELLRFNAQEIVIMTSGGGGSTEPDNHVCEPTDAPEESF